MYAVIKVTADTNAANACGLSFQIQSLAYKAAFPEQASIKPRCCFDGFAEFRDHAQTKGAVASNRLMAGKSFSLYPTIL